MSAPRSSLRPLDRVSLEALAGEILGAPVVLKPAPGYPAELAGTLVDETLSTVTVRPAGGTRLVQRPKAGLDGTVVLPAGELPLKGELLRVRPEDRTKRLLLSGARRFP